MKGQNTFSSTAYTSHTTALRPIITRGGTTDNPVLNLCTTLMRSRTVDTAAPALLLDGQRSITPHRTLTQPWIFRRVAGENREFFECRSDSLAMWVSCCSGVIRDVNLAWPAERTVKARIIAQRKESIEVRDIVVYWLC